MSSVTRNFDTKSIGISESLREQFAVPKTIDRIKIVRASDFVNGPGLQVITNDHIDDNSRAALNGKQRNWIIFHDSGAVSRRFDRWPVEITRLTAVAAALASGALAPKVRAKLAGEIAALC